ncbi:MAG: hypothetical protein NTX92_00120, partial [Euryarchaeota archaeon]|nr:hypothetical protein [Euryarchaeota archaeon]
IIFIIVLGAVFLFYLADSFLFANGDLTTFLSFSLDSIVMWIDVFLTIFSLIIIPYGFVKRKNWARIYAFVFLSWSIVRTIVYIAMTGEKLIGFLLLVLFVISMMYLLLSPVKRYFGRISEAIVPVEILKEYTYGLYTLYSELVHLKNGKNQIIYFFSKRKPKSGTPTTFPDGFQVEVSKRSGLPYLKKETI